MIKTDRVQFTTEYGVSYLGKCEDIIKEYIAEKEFRKVDLLFTSPPFPLNRAKKYGNMTGDEYIEWMRQLAGIFKEILADDGSIVMELGNAWEKGNPIQSLLPIQSLMTFLEAGEFYLCQEFIHYNPAKLPTPVEWVNKERCRVKDSFTRIWWMSKSPKPKANNKNVLVPYSRRMEKLLERQSYNSGRRPSEHVIGDKSFNTDNGGAIPSNLIWAANTSSNDKYLLYCKEKGLDIHPARMPQEIPEFFIKFLTDEGDLVLDPFAGSNTTGSVCEKLKRNWIAIEAEGKYIKGSIGRFEQDQVKKNSIDNHSGAAENNA